MADATGQEGKTIHRLLGYKPECGFRYNEEKQFDTNMVILDEAGMLDCSLALSLLKAIPTGAKLVILGDTAQLESIAW